jgi:hypothetical protein
MASMGEMTVKWDPESLAAINALTEELKALREDTGKTVEVRYEPARCRCPAQLHARYKGPAYSA